MTERILEALQEHLRGAKGRSQLTHAEIGEMLGLPTRTVGWRLVNVPNIDVKHFVELCVALGANPDELLTAAVADARKELS